jgi:hypothetical protein
MITINPNTASKTISSPRLLPGRYKGTRKWWGARPSSTMKYTCFCQLKFETERALEAHIRRAHDPAGDAA